MKILFATANQRKLGEARLACDAFGIEVEQIKLDITEIQSNDPTRISEHKANEAFRLCGRPVTITDTSWNIPALGGFPGGYMHDVTRWFKPTDFIHLMATKRDRRISFTETIVYQDADQTKSFSKQFWGLIAAEPRGKAGGSVEKIAEFDGHTIAERMDQGRFSHNPEDYIWYQFAQWFSDQQG